MSATPEDFLAAQGPPYLAAPDFPFSPPVFLDLPPTPRPNGDDLTSDDPASSDNLVLPFISRMLMEDDIDYKFFYQFPDHPALLTAQQPYAQVLSDSAAPTSSGTSGNSTLSSSSAARICRPQLALRPNRALPLLPSPPYEVNAVFLPGQDAAFQPSPAFLVAGGGGGQLLDAPLTAQNAGGGGPNSSALHRTPAPAWAS